MAAGMALAQEGRNEEAIARYQRALKIDDGDTNCHYVLGVLHRRIGQLEAAMGHYRKAVTLAPGHANAWYNLGNILAEQGQMALAEEAFGNAVTADPTMAVAWNNLGNIYKRGGQRARAIEAYRRSMAIEPNTVDTLFNLGEVYRSQGAFNEAVDCFKKSLALVPDHIASLNNLGATYRDMNRLDAAITCLQKAVSLAPEFGSALVNLGNSLCDRGDYQAAVGCFERALKVTPESPIAHTNFANLLQVMGDLDGAVQHFKAALAQAPDFADGHYNLGLHELLVGQYAEGWSHFNWRWQLDGFRRSYPQFTQPLWVGQPLAGKTLLVWDEQGVGDTLLFAGVIPDLLVDDCQLLFYGDGRLIPLMNRSFPDLICRPKPPGEAPVVAAGDKFDYHAPIGNLGAQLRPSAVAFGASKPYLRADPERRKSLRQRYQADKDSLLIGLAWHSKGPDSGPRKSIDLMDLQPILQVPGVRFVDLQYGDTAQQRDDIRAKTGVEILHDATVDQIADLDLFAAQTAAMDLVVCISNTTAHMAGGLGVPTLLLSCHIPIWYWMTEGDRSPWYPSLRLFRQAQVGDWSEVISAVATELKSRSEKVARS